MCPTEIIFAASYVLCNTKVLDTLLNFWVRDSRLSQVGSMFWAWYLHSFISLIHSDQYINTYEFRFAKWGSFYFVIQIFFPDIFFWRANIDCLHGTRTTCLALMPRLCAIGFTSKRISSRLSKSWGGKHQRRLRPWRKKYISYWRLRPLERLNLHSGFPTL